LNYTGQKEEIKGILFCKKDILVIYHISIFVMEEEYAIALCDIIVLVD